MGKSMAGRAELSVKVGSLPPHVETLERNVKAFVVDVGGAKVQVRVSPKGWKRWFKDMETHAHWVAIFKAPVELADGMLRFSQPVSPQVVPDKKKLAEVSGPEGAGGKPKAAAKAPSSPAPRERPKLVEVDPAWRCYESVPSPAAPPPTRAQERKLNPPKVARRRANKAVQRYRDPMFFGEG